MENKYKEFYENVDREGRYSAAKLENKHPFYAELDKYIVDFSLKDRKALEIGSGIGLLQDIVNDYTGIDVSESVKKYYHKNFYSVNENSPYPFQNEEFDFIFTYAVFEHIPNLTLALKEMLRVLKFGGLIFFRPAFNCRSWAAEGYQVRPYSDFNYFGKIVKFFIPLRNSKLMRALYIFPKRLYFLCLFKINKQKFTKCIFYDKLKPNYEIFWQSDSDAINSIDPFLSILFFKANNLKVVNYPSLFSAFFAKSSTIILKK